jgi:molybdopterin-guanine dinucleotide biosynthesis protein B
MSAAGGGTSPGSAAAAAPRVLLVVSAASGAGKTTLLERLVPLLVAGGLRVAAIKRSHHDVDLDPPGKDSRRLRDAGAAPVILQGQRTTTLFAPTPPAAGGDDDLAPLVAAAAALRAIDLVVVEGGRSLPRHPRIEVVAPGGRAVSDASLLVAVAAEDPLAAPAGVPRFRRDDVAGIAARVLAVTSAGPRPPSSA